MMAVLSYSHIILILVFQFVLLPPIVYSTSHAENEPETIQNLKSIYSALYIHEYFHLVSVFPNSTNDNRLKLVEALIQVVQQRDMIEQLQDLTPTVTSLKTRLRTVTEDVCKCIHEVSGFLIDGENCTLAKLNALQQKIKSVDKAMHIREVILDMLPGTTSLGYNDYCSYWNGKIMKNCTVVNEALTQVKKEILEPRFRTHANNCELCSVSNG